LWQTRAPEMNFLSRKGRCLQAVVENRSGCICYPLSLYSGLRVYLPSPSLISLAVAAFGLVEARESWPIPIFSRPGLHPGRVR
jgi:hypothetical protein